MRTLLLAGLSVLGACASAPLGTPAPEIGTGTLAAQIARVESAMKPLAAERTAREVSLGRAGSGVGDDGWEEALQGFEARERAILEPLAAEGNAEASYRLATRLRDSDAPQDVRRWFALTNEASRMGHPQAHQELVRWYWHQRGDGSIEDVQANRATAMDYADKAAAQGVFFSIARIAVYIAGDVHQYPANPALARRLLELCAQTGASQCQEELVARSPYDYRLTPAEAYHWLFQLAARSPARFNRARDLAYDQLSPGDQAIAKEAANRWRPASWSDLRPQWLRIRSEILSFGQRSVGSDAPCMTARPWCRGAFIANAR